MIPAERVTMAEILLESIEHEGTKIKEAWVSEVFNRMKSVEEGTFHLIDIEK